jgi:DNA-binding SARP family transcriptional activator
VSVEYRVLGPIEAVVDGQPAALGGVRQRAVLAVLLVAGNQLVPADRLIDGVWDAKPPDTADNVLQGYVSQLRKALGREAIETRGTGYLAHVSDRSLDLHAFERLAGGGADELRAALALWRGPALADLAHLPGVQPIAARLDELRLAALERWLEIRLEGGHPAAVAAELEPLVAEHPYRERLRALRMRALYRDGRQAEALAEFRSARARLHEDLGIEPGLVLRDLEAAILRQEAHLEAPTAPPETRQAPRTIVAAAPDPAALQRVLDVAEPLVAAPERELVVAAVVGQRERLADALSEVRAAVLPLLDRGVQARWAAFTAPAPGSDLAWLANEQDADLLLTATAAAFDGDAELRSLLETALCDVAVVTGAATIGSGPVLVPFAGAEHDWAAIEVGAWLARAHQRPMALAGAATGPEGRDASRLLASASLALQRALGVDAEPLLVEPSPAALLAEAKRAGVVVVGLTERWHHGGIGETRAALAEQAQVPVLLVRRGLRPGGVAPRTEATRFTWTIAG